MLSIWKTNKFGDNCYIPSIGNSDIPLPIDEGFWTIKNPTTDIIEHYSHNNIREYNGNHYLLSSKANSVLSPHKDTFGSASVLCFEYKSKKYFVLTVDNKKYLQNPQGGGNIGEEPCDAIIREVKEELNVEIMKEQCKEIGGWKFKNYNELVETEFLSTTHLFFIEVSFEQVKHLIQHELMPNELNIFSVEKYDFKLDETEYVIMISEDYLVQAPEKITLVKKEGTVLHSFEGHHREAILRSIGKTKYEIKYLLDFFIN
jgi:8-oxo-dGTP pyrophosphatase MutT (NUDIX family)